MWKATPESPRMFESDFIDAFSRVPWYVVPIVFVPVIAGTAGYALHLGESLARLAGELAAGLVAWTLLEYWLHRTVFHWVPAAAWGERFHFLLHGVHHQWYEDRLRLVMPPAASLSIGVALWGALTLLAHLAASVIAPTWVPGFFSGVCAGYLTYDLTHYYVHHAKPRTRVGMALRAHHAKHHHNAKYKDKKFGVSTTLWDHVFRTYE